MKCPTLTPGGGEETKGACWQARPYRYWHELGRSVRTGQVLELDIDYSLPHLHPMEFVIDHVIPMARGGESALHNIRAAH